MPARSRTRTARQGPAGSVLSDKDIRAMNWLVGRHDRQARLIARRIGLSGAEDADSSGAASPLRSSQTSRPA